MTSKNARGIAITLAVFVAVWLLGIGLMYAQFASSPTKEMDTRNGVIIGEKGFLEARAAACVGFTMLLLPVAAAVLVRVGTGGARRAGTQTPGAAKTPAGWYPDPGQGHEYRYWDGLAWTERVSDGGATSTDPPTT